MDEIKINATISDSISRLNLLNLINVQDDSSSELAGYEISKLLSEQRQLESNYAELIRVRGTL